MSYDRSYEENLFNILQDLDEIWFYQEETLEEAIKKTKSKWGKWRRVFADLMFYQSKDKIIYYKNDTI